jgi:hypothetical protein
MDFGGCKGGEILPVETFGMSYIENGSEEDTNRLPERSASEC